MIQSVSQPLGNNFLMAQDIPDVLRRQPRTRDLTGVDETTKAS